MARLYGSTEKTRFARQLDPSRHEPTTSGCPIMAGQLKLQPGTRLGPYEIVSVLGVGGFGEVYKAHDARLNRSVAIKILPSTAPDLATRFQREAKAIAALQHPHICTLFDIGRDNDIDYLVLEYLEGQTLADRLKLFCIRTRLRQRCRDQSGGRSRFGVVIGWRVGDLSR
jgi:serine/threonine protein kinase